MEKFNYKKLKTVADCFKARGLDPKVLPNDKRISKKHNNQLQADYIRTIVTEAINMDENGKAWEPNWLDSNEWKYQFWGIVKVDKKHHSGLGFSYSHYDFTRTNSIVGSRHCFKDYDRFDHARTHFIKVFQNDIFA